MSGGLARGPPTRGATWDSWTTPRSWWTSDDEQVDAAIEKAGDLADDKTGGKYADQIDKAQDFAEEKTGDGDTAG